MDRKLDIRLLWVAVGALALWLLPIGWKALNAYSAPVPQTIDVSEHGGTVHFEADRSTVVFDSDCVTVSWHAENIQAVFLGDEATIGVGTQPNCGDAPRLHVVFRNGSDETYVLSRDLVFDFENSLLTLALGGLVAYLLCASLLVTPQHHGSTSLKRQEIRPLTSYRGVAAALVFFFHQPIPVDRFFYALQIEGAVGVTLFFVLSGFLIASRYMDDVVAGVFRWRTYLVRRAARILPVYYAIVIIAALGGDHFNLANLTLTQSFFPGLWSSGIKTAWTLTLEESFYLLLPFILWLCWRTKRPWWVLGGAVAALYGLGCLLVAAGIWPMEFMVMRTIGGRMIDFMIGVGCAFVYRRWQPGKGAWLLTLLCCAGLGVWVTIVFPVPDKLTIIYGDWVAALLAGGLILSLTTQSGWIVRVLRWSPFVYIGRISYALYLVQLIEPVERLRATLRPMLGDASSVVLYAVVTLICIVLYELIEKPSHRWILRRFSATGSPAKAASLSST